MNSLIEVLKEQESFGFTGKVNLLSHDNGQFLGVIYQQEGVIVGASFCDLKDHKALVKMIFDDLENNQHFKFVVEPEILGMDKCRISLTLGSLIKDIQIRYQEYQHVKKLRPASNLRLIVDPQIIVSNDDLTAHEFDILSTITEYSKVSDIYKYSKLLDYEITTALVSLRKKKALKVFK